MISPGEVWNDTDGNPIQAHGGGILARDGVYYWYGEDKTYGAGNAVGVHCYSSRDLAAWKNEGIVLPKEAVPEKFRETGVLERPKVLYNAATSRYVMWMHLDAEGYSVAQAGVAVADTPTGPFTLVAAFRPISSSTFRDMNLFQDEDGAAYVFYAGEDNATMHIVRLNREFTAPEQPMVEGETWARAFVSQSREAPAPFKCRGRYYVITSGCTGWASNAADIAVANHTLGPWTSLGNPCAGEDADTTFGAQSTFVLPAPGRPDGDFLFLADRWKPHDLADSRCVWLPFRVGPDGRVTLEWRDNWDLDAFED
jgi:hypothetical protein